MASASVVTQFIRNFLCVLRSILGLALLKDYVAENSILSQLVAPISSLTSVPIIAFKYNITASQNFSFNLSANHSETTALITVLIAITQFLAIIFNFNSGIQHIRQGYQSLLESRKYRKAASEVLKVDNDDLCSRDETAFVTSVIKHTGENARSRSMTTIITGLWELIFSFAFLMLCLNSVRISVGSDMTKLVVDSFAVMEVGLLYFLYLAWKAILNARRKAKLLRWLSEALTQHPSKDKEISLHSILLLVEVQRGILPSFLEDLDMLVSISSELKAPHFEKANELLQKIQKGDPATARQAAVDLWGLWLTGSTDKRDKKVRKTGEEVSVLKTDIVKVMDRQAAKVEARNRLDFVLFLLNVVAGYGYLLAIVSYYFPAGSAQPNWVKSMKQDLSDENADWYGNFAGDLAWTIEPFLIIVSSLLP